ncbi:hypothetical protein SAMN05216420_10410 [Nitrosospira sp. Nl5]|uniref:hypothetical protein n=1 Tax=Nitrosospira sp. Nl5 TaxID=200120 RepID=UPI000883E56D|nr:hypothetical protein [Nitrosospira sp. Nl5]SCY25586.1 hypothetical protein SAMN05216420_10410 [Nitrosospira sp. Nl5]
MAAISRLGSGGYGTRRNGIFAGKFYNDGSTVETSLRTGITATVRIKKPGIPANAAPWLRNTLEILTGRRGNKITVPVAQALTFSATPTKAECEALYAYTNEVRAALNEMITRFDS